jgi:hypothetical protein
MREQERQQRQETEDCRSNTMTSRRSRRIRRHVMLLSPSVETKQWQHLFAVFLILHQFLLSGAAAAAAATLRNNYGSATRTGYGLASNRRNFSSFSSRSIESTSFLDTKFSQPLPLQYSSNDNDNDNNHNNNNNKNNMFIMMGKGDGKQRRKKQDASPPPASAPAPAQPAAPRVSTDINIPIKRQIMYGKLNKQFRQNGGTSFRQINNKKVARTKYRRTWGR